MTIWLTWPIAESRDLETAATTAALRRADDASAAISADVNGAVSADVGAIVDVDDAVAATVCAHSEGVVGGSAMTSTRASSLSGRKDAGFGVVDKCRRDRGFIDISPTDSVR